MNRLRIAFLGTRGIPGNYGGFETFVEELSARLVERGHIVTAYCRTANVPAELRAYRGVHLVRLPAIKHKYLETVSHTFLSAIDAVLRRYDVVYVCNSANAAICFIPWLRHQKTVLNVDGLEWQRKKWGRVAKAYYRWSAKLAARMPIEVVTDAAAIQQYYAEALRRQTRLFQYGTELFERGYLSERVRALGLQQDRYVLYVSRMEPENNALLVVRAYSRVKTDMPLVMVGDAPYASDYIRSVKQAADSRVRFLGYRFGGDYHALQANAFVYVQATEVGGTHPALVEALGHRNAVLAHDVPVHREVVGEAGDYFRFRDGSDLERKLTALLRDGERIARYRLAAAERVQQRYSWEAITDAYEGYFRDLVEKP